MTEQEFTNLVNEHKATIYTVCYMFSKDEDEVNDLFQDILINLWRGIDAFKGDSKVSSWIYRVSLNTCISAERKKRIPTERLDLNIDLYEDNDADTKQIQMLHKRVHRLRPFIVLSFCYGSKASPTTKLGLSLAYQPSTYQYASHAFAKNLKI